MLSPTDMDPQEVEQPSPMERLLQVEAQLTSMTQELSRISLLQHSPGFAAMATASFSSPGLPVTFDPRLPAPNRYAGDPHECRGFLNQCEIQFELSPLRFPTARSRVAYMISLLSGKALAWASPIWERDTAMTRDYPRFLREFRQVFETRGRQIMADSSLFHISQGNRSVAEYALDFRTIAAETTWNNDSLSAAFWHGLSDAIKNQLATMERPTRLEDLIAVCIRVDQWLRERSERTLPRTTSRCSTSRSLVPYVSQTMDEPEPMQLGSYRLSTSERQHRRDVDCAITAVILVICCQAVLSGRETQKPNKV
ncbi:hypothetical protein FKM82_017426 [Ascaphus truei]